MKRKCKTYTFAYRIKKESFERRKKNDESFHSQWAIQDKFDCYHRQVHQFQTDQGRRDIII